MDPITGIVLVLAVGAATALTPRGGQVIVCLPTGDPYGHL